MIDDAVVETAPPAVVDGRTGTAPCGATVAANGRTVAMRAAFARMLKVTMVEWGLVRAPRAAR